ncbi:MAG: hypothetical protein COA76_16525 [Moritella sp.]|nr:MAG: hypothetical protein COA76_16525 [Moritella sp.]
MELFKDYASEEQCIEALFNWKWPDGFICLACSSHRYCSLKSRNIYQCNRSHHQTSVITNTMSKYST